MKSSTYLNLLAIGTFLGGVALLFLGSGAGNAFIAFSVFASGASICRTIEKQSK